jgi:hypothetical protein
VAAAGEVARSWGILPWSAGEVSEAARVCFTSWLNNRGGVGDLEAETAIHQVRAYFQSFGSTKFPRIEQLDPCSAKESILDDRLPKGGFRVVKADSTEWLVFPDFFKQEICRGLNDRMVAQVLMDRGYLIKGDGGRSTTKRVPKLGVKKFIVISSTIMEGEDASAKTTSEPKASTEDIPLLVESSSPSPFEQIIQPNGALTDAQLAGLPPEKQIEYMMKLLRGEQPTQ